MGLDVLVNKARTGKRACEQLLHLFKERAAIEEEYSKKIAKLNKSFLPKDEIGTLKRVYESLKAEMDVSARIHADAANNIRSNFEKSFADFIEQQSRTRKEVGLVYRVDLTICHSTQPLLKSNKRSRLLRYKLSTKSKRNMNRNWTKSKVYPFLSLLRMPKIKKRQNRNLKKHKLLPNSTRKS